MNDTLPPPLPPHALNKSYQYRLAKDPRGREFWMVRARFRGSKHRGQCGGAFGGKRR